MSLQRSIYLKKRVRTFTGRALTRLGVKDTSGRDERKMLVVGPPRGGFSLLISVLNFLSAFKKWRRFPLRDELQAYVPKASSDVYDTVEKYFGRHMAPEDLIISGEFRVLTGGPKWLCEEDRSRFCVRKYIGIRDKGDLTLVLSLPKFVMDFDEVIHSHYSPKVWLEDEYYKGYMKFASVRNPLDIITSAMFSLNALTSEYIQRFTPDDDHMAIRERLALPKLSNMGIVDGIASHYIGYFKEFLDVKDSYKVMKWEDLITEPENTIKAVARDAGIEVHDDIPRRIWGELAYRRQMKHHGHNIWRGKVGNWKEFMVNEHLEMLKQKGFDEILEALGYEKISFMDEQGYTPFQKKVAEHLTTGKPLEYEGDMNLWTFAFQKSNIKWERFGFKTFPGKPNVKVERSTIDDERLLGGLVDAVQETLGPIKENLKALYEKYGRL